MEKNKKLYSEILYQIIHNDDNEIEQEKHMLYLQNAFKISNQAHQELLLESKQKEQPKTLLNVEIIEAKNLSQKDCCKLSYVTLYLSTNTNHKYKTSMKEGTLNPIWKELISLPISGNIEEASLCLEVMTKSDKENCDKYPLLPFTRSGSKFVKLVGSVNIPLKSIPASGSTMCFNLDKKNSIIKVRLKFGSKIAIEMYRDLLKLLLLHELEIFKEAPNPFNDSANVILTQYITQSDIEEADLALIQWAVYTEVHTNHPLSYNLFSNLLNKLIKSLRNNKFCEDDQMIFWNSTKSLLPSTFSTIHKLQYSKKKESIQVLADVLNIIAKICMLQPPKDINLQKIDILIINEEISPNFDLMSTISQVVMREASNWFDHIIDNYATENNTNIEKLQFLITVVQRTYNDLIMGIELYHTHFLEICNFQYAKALYTIYQEKLMNIVKPEIIEIYKSIRRQSYVTFVCPEYPGTLSVDTSLLKLYLDLQRFVTFGVDLCQNDLECFEINNFHQWFYDGVDMWLDNVVLESLRLIDKAIEFDTFSPESSNHRHTCSAVDTLQILNQINVFWRQELNWPGLQDSYTFIAKIIDDICRCIVYYVDVISTRIEAMDKTIEEIELICKWCLAINNIDYIRQSLNPFTEELAELIKCAKSDTFENSLKSAILNSINTVENKTRKLLEHVSNMICLSTNQLLIKGANEYQENKNSIDEVMSYVDNNLATLHAELNKENFNKSQETIWNNLSNIICDLVQSNLDKKRSPSFFAYLHETLKLLIKLFKISEDGLCSNLQRSKELLMWNEMETTDLIHQMHLDMHEEQPKIEESLFGQLTVRLKFHDTVLEVEVMNARILTPNNETCDSYVRIYTLPVEKFVNVIQPKTLTCYDQNHPLYEEKIEIVMSSEQQKLEDGLIMFNVRESKFMGLNNQNIGEAFVHFKDIPRCDEPIESLPQMRLQLVKPSNLNGDALNALKNRQDNKQAKDFIKKLKRRVGPTNQ